MPLFNMPLLDMADLRAQVPPGHRLLGLDPGSKTIGLAVSDVTLLIATPRPPLPRAKLAANAAVLAALARRESAWGFVIGYPISLDGTMGPAAQAVRDWARALTEATSLPAALWDERLTTAAVTRTLLAADLPRAKRAAVVDSLAAAYTLQSALDATRPRSPQ